MSPLSQFADSCADLYAQIPTSSSLNPYPFVHRRRSAFASFWESCPRRLQACLPPSFPPSQPDADESIELQQRPGPSTSSIRSLRIAEVAVQQDDQACLILRWFTNGLCLTCSVQVLLHVAQRPERTNNKAKRIKNRTRWNRLVLFFFCVSHPPIDGASS